MSFGTGFMRGLVLPIEAATFLMNHRGVKRVAVLPFIASILLYLIIFVVAGAILWNWNITVGDWDFWGGFGAWLSDALDWILNTLKWIVAFPAVFVLAYYTFISLGTVIAAPFNDVLSARVEMRLCNPTEEQKMTILQTSRAAIASMWDAIKIVGRQAMWTILVLPLLFVPIVGFIPLLLVSSWFSGLGYLDIAMARNNLRNKHKEPLLAANRGEVLGLGFATYVLFLVPFAGLFLLPVAVTAGTMMYCRWDWKAGLDQVGLDAPKGFQAPVVKHVPPARTSENVT